jgi:hypothetical protein
MNSEPSLTSGNEHCGLSLRRTACSGEIMFSFVFRRQNVYVF